MSIKRIAQPFVVYWPHDERLSEGLREWCLANLLNSYVVFVAQAQLNYLVELEGPVHEKLGPTSVFMFECPRDAMLFKLTWGGS